MTALNTVYSATAKDYEALYVKAFNNFLVNPDLHNVKVLCQAAIKVGLDVSEVRKYINDIDSVNAFANEVERVAVKTEEVAFKIVQDERTCFGYATSSLVEYAQVIVNDPNNEGVFDNNRYFQDPIKARLERKVEIKRGQRRAAKYAN